MPIYTIFLWLINSPVISGEVFFEMISGHQTNDTVGVVDEQQQQIENNSNSNNHHPRIKPLIVYLQTKPVSLINIISSDYDYTLRTLKLYRRSTDTYQFMWDEFFNYIFTGEVLYRNFSYTLSFFIFLLIYILYVTSYLDLINHAINTNYSF